MPSLEDKKVFFDNGLSPVGYLYPYKYTFKSLGKEEYHFESITINEIIISLQDYIVVGEAGIGKTSFLHWIAKQFLSKSIDTKVIPLFVQLTDIAQIKLKDEFLSLLDTQYSIKKYNLEGWKFLFLLDGLDQIENFGNIVDRLKNKDIFGKENKIILTTRPLGYEWVNIKLEDRYAHLRILPFDKERIRKYIGKDTYDSIQFKSVLNQNKDLLRIPILLKMIKILLLNGKLSIIKNRTELYKGFIEYLFEKWERKKKEILSAYTRAKRIQQDLTMLSYHAIANNYLGSFPLNMGIQYISEERLNDLISWSVIHNLIEKDGKDVIAYTHQSFQEYLAAIQLKEELFKDDHFDRNLLEKCLEYRRWDETIIFTVGMIIEEKAKILINAIKKYDLYLACSCLSEHKGIRSYFMKLINDLFRNIQNEDARKAIVRMVDKKLIERLIELLKDKDSKVRMSVVDVLGDIDSDNTVESLISLLKVKDRDVRWNVVYALGRIGSDRAIELLVPLLKDKDRDVCWDAAHALGYIGSDKAIVQLTSLLKDRNSIVRRAAASSLGETGSVEAVESLITLLKDKNSFVRWDAANALGMIGSDRAIEPLIPLLKDKDEDVQSRAAGALGRIGSDRAIELLVPLLKDKDSLVRTNTVYVLGSTGSEKAVELLIPLLKDEDAIVRTFAAGALGEIGSDSAVESLIPLLEDKYVLWIAADALGMIGSDRAVEHLVSLLGDRDGYVRRSAANALGKLGTNKAVEPLISLLGDRDSYVRRSAADALGKLGTDKAVEPLISLLGDRDSYVRRSAADALGKLGTDKAVEPLISLLGDRDNYVRESAANALGGIATRLNREEQDKLVCHIQSLKLENKTKHQVLTQIKQATARRFIKTFTHFK